jgi:hypothetical protein
VRYQKRRNYYYALCFDRGFTLVKEEEGEEKVVTRPPRWQRRRQDHYCMVMAMGGDDLAARILGLEFVGINSCRHRSTHPIVLANTDVNDDNDNNIVVGSWSTKVSTQNGMHTIHAPPYGCMLPSYRHCGCVYVRHVVHGV